MLENTHFEYCIDPKADEPIMVILNQIGNSYDDEGNVTTWGVQGAQFCKELLLLDSVGKSRIQIWINSIGGSVIDGYSILGAMLKTKAKIDTYNIGIAASTAGWLFQAGRTRDMSDYATWMGHNPSSTTGEESEILTKFRDSIIKIISERTNTSIEETAAMLDKETYLTASECLAKGFCDTITATSTQNKKRMSAAATIQDKYKLALEISNIVLPNKHETVKTIVMDINNKLDVNITNALQLVPEASPAMVVKSISEIQNALIIEQGKVTEANKALTIANKAKEDLQAKYDDLCKDMQEVKDLMEKEAAETLNKEANEMVNGFAAAGKIKNDAETIAKWVNRAKVSAPEMQEIKNMLNDLPVNKDAKKIEEVVNIIGGNGAPKNTATLMHNIAMKHKQTK